MSVVGIFRCRKEYIRRKVKPWLTESLNDAVKFESKEDALKFFNENEHYLKYILSNGVMTAMICHL